jgi:tetratricopeptide (TPR) repeat protein
LKQFKLGAALLCLATALITASYSQGATTQQSQPNTKLGDLLKKGDDLYKANKFKEAIEAYREALAQDASNDHAISYIGYSYNKLHDNEQSRLWMKKRLELPGQTPSRKAQILTDITLLYWDEAHMDIAGRVASGGKSLKPEDTLTARKLLADGIESGQKAVAIAPRSVRAFNLLNLLYRESAANETDSATRDQLITRADEALRKSVEFFEAVPQQPSNDIWVVPTLSVINGTGMGQGVRFGVATKKTSSDALKDVKEGAAVIEVVVGRDGKVRLPRLLVGLGKLGDAALAAARQWEFEPTTFEGHAVQVIETISFPVK